MTSATSKARLGSEFDDFLFAPIGEDLNGLPLSVVSHLARLNLDPWQEAGSLATLSAGAAATRLASSLDTLTDPILRQASSETLVLRLLALLPRNLPAAPVRNPVAGAVAVPDLRNRIGTIVFIMSALVLLGSQILAAHRYTAIQLGAVKAPAAVTLPSQAPPAITPH